MHLVQFKINLKQRKTKNIHFSCTSARKYSKRKINLLSFFKYNFTHLFHGFPSVKCVKFLLQDICHKPTDCLNRFFYQPYPVTQKIKTFLNDPMLHMRSQGKHAEVPLRGPCTAAETDHSK